MSAEAIAILALGIVVMALLLWIAWRDFLTWRIANRDVLILLALFLPFAALVGWPGIVGNLMAGGLLFLLGVLFWLLRMMGAGDAKLFLPVGLFLGWNNLLPFAIGLFVFAALFLIILKLPVGRGGRGRIAERLTAIRETGHVPYGVPIALSAILAGL